MTRSHFYSAYEKEVDHLFMIVSISPGLTYACLSLHGLFVTHLKGVTFSQRKTYMIIEVMKNLFCGLS